MRRIFAFLLLAAFAAVPALAQKTVNLTVTDANNGTNVRYFIYHRMAGSNYVIADRKDAGTSKTYAYVLTAPIQTGTHFFASTAYIVEAGQTLESGYSNEVSWVNPPVPPTLAITSVAAVPSRKDAVLTAETSVPSDARLEYRMTGNPWWRMVSVDQDYAKTSHSVTLSGLRPHTPYEFRWTAKTQAGDSATADGSFITK